MLAKIMLIAITLILLLQFAFAQDSNVMTPEQIKAYIDAQMPKQPEQPQIITVQIDEETRQTMQQLKDQVDELKRSNDQLNQRFAQLATQTEDRIQASEDRMKSHLEEQLKIKLLETSTDLKDYIKTSTNPVRMNLPAIAVFAILSSAFLLWASRYYKPKGSSD